MEQKKIAVGIDIGTTTVSGIVIHPEDGQVLEIYNVPNDSAIPTENAWAHIQSPQRIWEIVKESLDNILSNYSVSSIGVTGQMHGILHTAFDTEPLSPLYTWQDMRANLGTPNACSKIEQLTSYRIPAGYGLATQYALMQENNVPKQAYYVCTIIDYITMRLCGLKRPVMHITNGASWGLYSHIINDFDIDALQKLGIPREILPVVVSKKAVIGEYQNIPVAVGIGDNQAAFLGSVTEPERSVLINVGTGSQVSLLSEVRVNAELIEARPFDGNRVLYSGSGLCGGRSYALLEKLFRSYAVACGLPDEPRYDVLNTFAQKGIDRKTILKIRTTFAGTRANSDLRGEITEIGEENFTPEAFAAGVLYGMVEELYEMYQTMPHSKVDTLIASGNGVRKNPVLQAVMEDVFGLKVQIPSHTEEAAFGAAMFGAEAI